MQGRLMQAEQYFQESGFKKPELGEKKAYPEDTVKKRVEALLDEDEVEEMKPDQEDEAF